MFLGTVALAGIMHASNQPSKTVFINNSVTTQSQHKTLFFDWHDVCVQTQWLPAIKKVGQTEPTYLGKVTFFASVVVALFDPRTWHAVWFTFAQKPAPASETFFNLIQHNGYEKLHNEMVAFANNLYAENHEMVELIQKLQAHGIPFHLFSNIGAKTLAYGIENNLYPNLLPLFKNINSINREVPENGIYPHKKPHVNTYSQALINTKVSSKNAVMIDNKEKNILGALATGWQAGIVFKNVSQLKTDLEKILNIAL